MQASGSGAQTAMTVAGKRVCSEKTMQTKAWKTTRLDLPLQQQGGQIVLASENDSRRSMEISKEVVEWCIAQASDADFLSSCPRFGARGFRPGGAWKRG